MSTPGAAQTIRVQNPPGQTILKTASGQQIIQNQAGKQIFTQASGAGGQQIIQQGQPPKQIITAGGQQIVQGQQGKQIITVHKGGQVSSQPQIVTLVKTTQGMTVAQVRRII